MSGDFYHKVHSYRWISLLFGYSFEGIARLLESDRIIIEGYNCAWNLDSDR